MNARSVVLAAFTLAAVAQAQNLELIVVPAVPLDATAPHFAYNGHATTFKAIARGGNGAYTYEWDFTGDGIYDFSATTSNRYRLDTRFTYPNQAADVRFTAKVRVTSNGQTITALYPVQVFTDVPADPNAATPRQLQVMRAITIDDALWYLHGQLARSGNEADPLIGAQVTGTFPSASSIQNIMNGNYLEALVRNGRYAAFPPAYLGNMPDPVQNAARWATDPYAEDAMRVLNSLLANVSVVGVTAADEANDTGFYPTVTRTPLPGTDDGIGLLLGTAGALDATLSGISALLRALAFSRLSGFVAQVGDANRVLGKPLELITQQLVDGLVWAQNDSGARLGSWYYTANTGNDLINELGIGTTDALQALWAVDTYMRNDGVIVPNLARARATAFMQATMRNCAEGGMGLPYFASVPTNCDLAQSFVPLFALGWGGANTFSATDTRLAFPSFFGLTRGQLRTLYNSNLTFLTNTFPSGQVSNNLGWDLGYVVNGDFSRTDGQGVIANMLHLMRSARAVEPEVTSLGANDFYRSFTRYLVRNQANTGTVQWVYSLGDNTDNNMGDLWRAAAMVLVLSPDDMQPVVTLTSSPATTAPEGTPVTFTGNANIGAAVTHAWTMGNTDTRSGSPVTYAYPDNGSFNVYDTVTTSAGTSAAHFFGFTVTNVAPTVDAGADVTIKEGSAVAFSGSFTDPGTADTWSFSWSFGDGTVLPAALASSHVYVDEGSFNAVLTVTDDDMGVGTDTAVVTVQNVAPIITSSPPTVVSQGGALSYTLTYVDPGVQDTQTCSKATAPVNATLVGCTLSWSPTAGQVGTHPFSLCVTDNDSGQTCQNFSVVVAPLGTNLPPTAPVLSAPAFGARVTTTQPTLTVTNASDPDGDALTYEFEVSLRGVKVAGQANVAAGGTGTTSWAVDTMLVEDTTYTWRARAVASQGPGPWSDVGQLTVNAANTSPPAVTLLTPPNESLVRTLTPTLTFLPWPDADGDSLVFDWELAADDTFASPLASGTGVTTNQLTLTTPLTEDARACWRVRSDDGQAKSAFTQGCFRVSAVDGAPSTVSHLSPAAGASVNTLAPLFAWTVASDPEGLPVTYELVVSDGTMTVATVATGGTATVLGKTLTDGETYQWRVRALTATGPAGAFSNDTSFTVQLPDAGMAAGGGAAGGAGGGAGGGNAGGGMAGGEAGGAGGDVAGGEGGGSMTAPAASGCGCTSGGGEWFALALLLLKPYGSRRQRR